MHSARITSPLLTPQAAEAKVNIDFCVSVAQKFPPAVQVLAAYKLIHHLVQLPEEKPTSE